MASQPRSLRLATAVALLAVASACGGPLPDGLDRESPDGGGGPDGGVQDAGAEVFWCPNQTPLRLSWVGTVATAQGWGAVRASLLDPPGNCYSTDLDIPFQFDLDRPAVLAAEITPIAFTPMMVLHRACQGPLLACGASSLRATLEPGTYLFVVASEGIGSGPDAGWFSLALTFTQPDGG